MFTGYINQLLKLVTTIQIEDYLKVRNEISQL